MPIAGEGERKTEPTLRRIAEFCMSVVEQAPDAIYVVDGRSRSLVAANAAFELLLGYSAEDVCRLTIYELVRDSREHVNARFQRALLSHGPIRGDREYRHKDGGVVCVDANAFRLQCPGPPLVCTVARDVTAHRQAERQLRWYRDQLRFLTSQLYLAEQRERRHTAQILHDQAGQMITAAILRLDNVMAAEELPRAISELEQIREILRSASQELRSLTLQLSPPMLHERGLCKAVEWLAQTFQSQYGFTVQLHLEPDLRLGEECSVVLFQSLRELLTNTAKHARATTVDIRLTTRSGMVDLSVRDNGVGFDPALRFNVATERIEGFGLFSIGERLTHLGGGLDVNSAPGAGTEVVLHLPLRE